MQIHSQATQRSKPSMKAEGAHALGARALRSQSSDSRPRRAYYRVEGRLPLRLTPLAPDEVEQAIFELDSPSAWLGPRVESEEEGALLERLRRLEEKLDLLLRRAGVEVPRPLGAADMHDLVFSGSGLATEVEGDHRRGELFRVEILLPSPAARLVRGVAEAVSDPPEGVGAGVPRPIALAFRHMVEEDRDALVAYSYELQRLALRAAHAPRDGRR